MKVEVDGPVIDPLGDLITDIRERAEVFLLFLKHLITATVTLLESLMVELIELVCNSFPEFREGVVHVIPAPGDDGGGDLTDSAFYRRLQTIIGNFR